MTNNKTNKSRRKVLQKAGVAGSAAGIAVWTKPSLNAIISPAHAQMSEPTGPMPLGGATSTSPTQMVAIPKESNQSIASKALNALVPEAKAGGDSPFNDVCGAFTENGLDDYRHCIALTFDEAAPNTDFTLDFTGPNVYYDLCFYDGSYAYYYGYANFSGMTSDTLDGQDFTVSVGDIEFTGTVADDFESASGTLISTVFRGDPGNSDVGTNARCGLNYGAYWSVTLDGTTCSYGAGVYNSGRTIMIDPGFCRPS